MALAVASLTLAFVSPPAGATTTPPGTAAQISKLVAASLAIKDLPATLTPSLLDVPYDTYFAAAPALPINGCTSISSTCTLGDPSAAKTVVLFGDSHAVMWADAIDPLLVQLKYRLQVLFENGCPFTSVPTYQYGIRYTACQSWQDSMITAVNAEHPALVLLGERTSNYYSGPGTLITHAQYSAGLESAIASLTHTGTKVALFGDTPDYTNNAVPAACLAVDATNIQKCDTPLNNPKPQWEEAYGAESAAVKATHATLINPIPWLCAKSTCAAVIGNMVVYYNSSHLTASYALYLSGVVGARVKKLL